MGFRNSLIECFLNSAKVIAENNEDLKNLKFAQIEEPTRFVFFLSMIGNIYRFWHLTDLRWQEVDGKIRIFEVENKGLDEMNNLIENTLAEINNAKQVYERLLEQAVEPVLKAIAESGKVSHLTVVAYLPNFNDGELCEHTVDFHFNIRDLLTEELFDRLSVLKKVFDEDFVEQMEEVDYIPNYRELDEKEMASLERAKEACESVDAIFDYENDATLNNAVQTIIVPYLDSRYQTNYQVVYAFNKDGTYKMFYDEYYCGY